jgi:hypothetical protein
MSDEFKPPLGMPGKWTPYHQGFLDGLRAYAHWKDGTMYVGTCGTTLREASLRVEEHSEFSPPKQNENHENKTPS